MHQRSQVLCHLYPGIGLKLGVFWFFLVMKMAREDRGRIGFACMVGENPKTSKLSSMADDAIHGDGMGGLGSLVYICD